MPRTASQTRLLRRTFTALGFTAAVLAGVDRKAAEARSRQLPPGPELERVHIRGLDSLAPRRFPATVAIAPTGIVALVGGPDPQQPLITTIDTSGRVLARFARRGIDIGVPAMLRFFGDTLFIYDSSQPARVHAFSALGKLLYTRPLPAAGRVLQLLRDSVDIEMQPWTDSASVRRVATAGGGGRDLIPVGDSAFTSAALWRTRNKRPPGFALGGTGSAVLLGEGFRYRLLLFTATGLRASGGRDLPPRGRSPLEVLSIMRASARQAGNTSAVPSGISAEAAALRRDTLQHFALVSSIHQDMRGRFWVIGERNDSTFADVFDGVRFIKRTMLPCRAPGSSPSLRGAWLALTCLREGTTDDRDVETQVYFIADPV